MPDSLEQCPKLCHYLCVESNTLSFFVLFKNTIYFLNETNWLPIKTISCISDFFFYILFKLSSESMNIDINDDSPEEEKGKKSLWEEI